MIRLATETDIPQILDIYAPYVLNTAVSFEYTVPTLEEFTRRFQDITRQFPWLVWEENGKILGYAYGSLPFGREAYRWCAANSIYLCPEAQGKGIGRKLCGIVAKLHRINRVITSCAGNNRHFFICGVNRSFYHF